MFPQTGRLSLLSVLAPFFGMGSFSLFSRRRWVYRPQIASWAWHPSSSWALPPIRTMPVFFENAKTLGFFASPPTPVKRFLFYWRIARRVLHKLPPSPRPNTHQDDPPLKGSTVVFPNLVGTTLQFPLPCRISPPLHAVGEGRFACCLSPFPCLPSVLLLTQRGRRPFFSSATLSVLLDLASFATPPPPLLCYLPFLPFRVDRPFRQ